MNIIYVVIKVKGHCLYLANLNVSNELFCPEQIAATLSKFTIWLLIFEAIN